ncbi:MAG TPA: nucleotidyltransferase [Spirochaetota bacterium]|mgnify:CR=1 FL=1|nr:nucleotidyltransferase [Spirochaetota bacterium]HOL56157.1 nucleotidyltransferase [Spirochaetota bacterium]HPP03606.1 nucleotidyltransferase [Spirochaetota bacterium]
MDFKNVLLFIITKFEEKKIKYGIIGGFALSQYGVNRDISDLHFFAEREDAEKIDNVMQEAGYSCFNANLNVAQYISPLKEFGEIDFIFSRTEIGRTMLERVNKFDIFGNKLKVNILRPEDLIGLKLHAIRNDPSRKEKDLIDIILVLKINKNIIDFSIIENYCNILNLTDIYETIIKGIKK